MTTNNGSDTKEFLDTHEDSWQGFESEPAVEPIVPEYHNNLGESEDSCPWR